MPSFTSESGIVFSRVEKEDPIATRNFLEAAKKGDLNVLKRLVSKLKSEDGLESVAAKIKDKSGWTALHFAAAEGRTNVCKYLIEEVKLNVDIKDGQGEVPLHQATIGNHLQTVTYLLEKGADITKGTDQGMTALHFAAEKGYKTLIKLLISNGAVVDAEADSGTPLQWASGKGKKEAVKILLENKANPNKIAHHIFSPLVGSLLAKSFECVKLLLKFGADPNSISSGVTALHIASAEGETEMVKCFLKAGANPNAVNNYSLTPLEVAALHGHLENAMILFPVTSPIPSYPDWSYGGIIKYVHSNEAKEQRKLKEKEYFSTLKVKGQEAIQRKDYINATYWYTMAIETDPTDASVLSNRSLCFARLKDGEYALLDARACISLRPDWPKAYYREGVALRLLEKHEEATHSFLKALGLDPNTKELETAYSESSQTAMVRAFEKAAEGLPHYEVHMTTNCAIFCVVLMYISESLNGVCIALEDYVLTRRRNRLCFGLFKNVPLGLD